MFNPLEQFKLISLINVKLLDIIDISINTTVLYLIIFLIIILLMLNMIYNNKLILHNWMILITNLYNIWVSQFNEIIPKIGRKYYIFLINLFIFITINNLIGLVPYSFSITSQIIITLTFSLSIMIGVTIIGIQIHKTQFIYLFIPSGLPIIIIPMIFIIEIISYLIRIASLSIRLAANITSGHTILFIISNFGLTLPIFAIFKLIFLIPLLIAIFTLEFGVSLIQGFIFTILTAIYIKDILSLH